MKLHVRFDDEIIQRYTARGSNPFFAIYWTHEGVAYPEEQWLDFGSVILSWWLRAARELLAGADEVELDFMDGPYTLTARATGDKLSVAAPELQKAWSASKQELIWELISAAEHIVNKLAELSLPDTNSLEDSIPRVY